jgi:hypothetical protein
VGTGDPHAAGRAGGQVDMRRINARGGVEAHILDDPDHAKIHELAPAARPHIQLESLSERIFIRP